MERKIGEIFEFGGEWYQCVNQNGCCNCAFYNTSCHLIDELSCKSLNKKRKEKYIFKKLEKVGEPYEFDGHLFQSYRTFEVPIFTENYATVRQLGNNSKISIEIKQTEDMEEKGEMTLDDAIKHYDEVGKHSISKECTLKNFQVRDWLVELKKYKEKECFNSESIEMDLRKFDLEAAKAGKPVCTRDGRKARIICFDANGSNSQQIIALITDENGFEYSSSFTNEGRWTKEVESVHDLMIIPEKRSGWAVIRRSDIYETEEQAVDAILNCRVGVMIRKITWEE